MHVKPIQDGKIDSAGLADIMRQMGVEPEQVLFRYISKDRINAVIANGTDRDRFSINHNDHYGRGTNYEALAMAEHGVYDGSYTSYLNDGASLLRPESGFMFDQHSAVVIYRKDQNIISINSFKYLKSGESPNSFGFHIFKKSPSNFLVGVISADGQPLKSASRPQTHSPQQTGESPSSAGTQPAP